MLLNYKLHSFLRTNRTIGHGEVLRAEVNLRAPTDKDIVLKAGRGSIGEYRCEISSRETGVPDGYQTRAIKSLIKKAIVQR